MIVYQSTFKIQNVPHVHSKLKRAYEITALGVTFNNTLFYGPDVRIITSSLYDLETLRCRGLGVQALWDVTRATLVTQLSCACPFWRGFINADETNKL